MKFWRVITARRGGGGDYNICIHWPAPGIMYAFNNFQGSKTGYVDRPIARMASRRTRRSRVSASDATRTLSYGDDYTPGRENRSSSSGSFYRPRDIPGLVSIYFIFGSITT